MSEVRGHNGEVMVVMPAYNAGDFLDAAALSVLDQTYPQVRLAIVDDGSTDNTWNIAKRLGREPNVQLARHRTNMGIATTRNRCLDLGLQASGSATSLPPAYVAFLDADDVWQPTYLERLVGVLETSDTQTIAAYSGVDVIDASGNVTGSWPDAAEVASGQWAQQHGVIDFDGHLATGHPEGLQMTVFRAEPFNNGLRFDPRFERAEDMALIAQSLLQGGQIVGVPDRLVQYRRHPGQTTNDRVPTFDYIAAYLQHYVPLMINAQRRPEALRNEAANAQRRGALAVAQCLQTVASSLEADPAAPLDALGQFIRA